MLHLLPPHVIKSTIEYVVESPDDVNMFLMEDTDTNVFQPLVHICQAWRAVSLPIMFAACDAAIGNTLTFAYRSVKSAPCIITHMDPHYNPMVRTLALELDFSSLVNGSASSQLEEGEFAQICFPNADTVTATLTITEIMYPDETACTAAMAQFVAHMTQMLPALHQVSLTVVDNTGDRCVLPTGALKCILDYFTSKPGPVSLDIQHASKILTDDTVQSVHSLSKLICCWTDNYTVLAHMLHTHAVSLDELHICYTSNMGIERLVVDELGDHFTYPYLNKLVLSKKYNKELPMLPPLHSVAPFPRLKSLDIAFAYPFCNDLPFRGNRSSLMNLRMLVDSRTLNCLNACGIFKCGHLSALTSISLAEPAETYSLPSGNKENHTQLLSCMLPQVMQFCTLDQQGSERLLEFLPTKKTFANIQMLSLVHKQLSLLHMAMVIHALPGLQHLQCAISHIGGKFEHTDIKQVTDLIKSKYSMDLSRLQVWKLPKSSDDIVSATAASVVILGSCCPWLKSVTSTSQTDDTIESVYSKLAYSSFYTVARQEVIPKIELRLDKIDTIYNISLIRRICK